MSEFLIDLAVSTLITLLRGLQATRPLVETAKYRKVFLKIQTFIWGVYGEDASFRAVVGAPVEHDPELIAEAGPIVYPGGRSNV